MKAKKPRIVYLMFTSNPSLGENYLLAVYSLSNYQTAFNRMADIADRHGVKLATGEGTVAVQVMVNAPEAPKKIGRDGGQIWWLERHEVR